MELETTSRRRNVLDDELLVRTDLRRLSLVEGLEVLRCTLLREWSAAVNEEAVARQQLVLSAFADARQSMANGEERVRRSVLDSEAASFSDLVEIAKLDKLRSEMLERHTAERKLQEDSETALRRTIDDGAESSDRQSIAALEAAERLAAKQRCCHRLEREEAQNEETIARSMIMQAEEPAEFKPLLVAAAIELLATIDADDAWLRRLIEAAEVVARSALTELKECDFAASQVLEAKGIQQRKLASDEATDRSSLVESAEDLERGELISCELAERADADRRGRESASRRAQEECEISARALVNQEEQGDWISLAGTSLASATMSFASWHCRTRNELTEEESNCYATFLLEQEVGRSTAIILAAHAVERTTHLGEETAARQSHEEVENDERAVFPIAFKAAFAVAKVAERLGNERRAFEDAEAVGRIKWGQREEGSRADLRETRCKDMLEVVERLERQLRLELQHMERNEREMSEEEESREADIAERNGRRNRDIHAARKVAGDAFVSLSQQEEVEWEKVLNAAALGRWTVLQFEQLVAHIMRLELSEADQRLSAHLDVQDAERLALAAQFAAELETIQLRAAHAEERSIFHEAEAAARLKLEQEYSNDYNAAIRQAQIERWTWKVHAEGQILRRAIEDAEQVARTKAYQREDVWRSEFLDASFRSHEDAIRRSEQNMRLRIVRDEDQARDGLEADESSGKDNAAKLARWGTARRGLEREEASGRSACSSEEDKAREVIERMEQNGQLGFITELEECGRSTIDRYERESRGQIWTDLLIGMRIGYATVEDKARTLVTSREETERSALQKLFLSFRLQELNPSAEVYALLAAQMVDNETVKLPSGMDVTKKDLLEIALSRDPTHAPSYVALASTLSGTETCKVGGKVMTKRQLCTEAISLDPKMHTAYLMLGSALGDKESIKVPQSSSALDEKASGADSTEPWTRVKILAAGVALCPSSAEGFLLLANALSVAEKVELFLDDARAVKSKKDCYLEALKLDPSLDSAYYGLGQLLQSADLITLQEGKNGAATSLTKRQCFVRTLELNSAHPLARKSLAGVLQPHEHVELPDGSVITRDNWQTTAHSMRKSKEEREKLESDEHAQRVDLELELIQASDAIRQELLNGRTLIQRKDEAVLNAFEERRQRVIDSVVKAEAAAVAEEDTADHEKEVADDVILAGIAEKIRVQKQHYTTLLADRERRAKEAKEQAIRLEAERIAKIDAELAERRKKLNEEKSKTATSDTDLKGADPVTEEAALTPEEVEQRREAARVAQEARELLLREEAERQATEDAEDDAKTAEAMMRVNISHRKTADVATRCAIIVEESLRHAKEFIARRAEIAQAREDRAEADRLQAEKDAERQRQHEARTAAEGSAQPVGIEMPSDPHMRAMMEWLLPQHKRAVVVDNRRGQLTADEERRERADAEERDSADMETMAITEEEERLRAVETFTVWEESASKTLRDAERAARDEIFRRLRRCIERQQRFEKGDWIKGSSRGSNAKAAFDEQLTSLKRLLLPRDKRVDVDTRKGSLQSEEERRLNEEKEARAAEELESREKLERERTVAEEEALAVWEELDRKLLREQDRAIRAAALRRSHRIIGRGGRYAKALQVALHQFEQDIAREAEERVRDEQKRPKHQPSSAGKDTAAAASPTSEKQASPTSPRDEAPSPLARPETPLISPRANVDPAPADDFHLVEPADSAFFDGATTDEQTWTAMCHEVRGLIATKRILPAWLELEKMRPAPSAQTQDTPSVVAQRTIEWITMRREARESLLLSVQHWTPADEQCPKNSQVNHANMGVLGRDWQCLYCFKSLWCPDNKTCQKCKQPTRLMSRHHCRICGQTICGKCERKGSKQSAAAGRVMGCIQDDVTLCQQCVELKVGRAPSDLSDSTVPPATRN